MLNTSKKLSQEQGFKILWTNKYLTESERVCDYELRKERKRLNESLTSKSTFRYAVRGQKITKLKKIDIWKPKDQLISRHVETLTNNQNLS